MKEYSTSENGPGDDVQSSTEANTNRCDAESTPTDGRSKANGSADPKPKSYSGPLRTLPPALAPLTVLRHWVLWRWQLVKNKKGEKWTKVPYQPNGFNAKNNDPATWSSYDTVLKVLDQFDGIGFCLLNSGYAAFDIDDCRDPT